MTWKIFLELRLINKEWDRETTDQPDISKWSSLCVKFIRTRLWGKITQRWNRESGTGLLWVHYLQSVSVIWFHSANVPITLLVNPSVSDNSWFIFNLCWDIYQRLTDLKMNIHIFRFTRLLQICGASFGALCSTARLLLVFQMAQRKTNCQAECQKCSQIHVLFWSSTAKSGSLKKYL